MTDIFIEDIDAEYTSIGMIILGIIIVGTIFYLRRSRKKSQSIRN